jgi:hypothetical protein
MFPYLDAIFDENHLSKRAFFLYFGQNRKHQISKTRAVCGQDGQVPVFGQNRRLAQKSTSEHYSEAIWAIWSTWSSQNIQKSEMSRAKKWLTLQLHQLRKNYGRQVDIDLCVEA